MGKREIIWREDENGKTLIYSEGINKQIEIDEENKNIINAKAFFREIVFDSFLNDDFRKITLKGDVEEKFTEVEKIINKLIVVCNEEIENSK